MEELLEKLDIAYAMKERNDYFIDVHSQIIASMLDYLPLSKADLAATVIRAKKRRFINDRIARLKYLLNIR